MTLPGHLMLLLHVLFPLSEPKHFLPPFDGFGLLQERDLTWCPPPHVREHIPYLLHEDQFPSIRLPRVGGTGLFWSVMKIMSISLI